MQEVPRGKCDKTMKLFKSSTQHFKGQTWPEIVDWWHWVKADIRCLIHGHPTFETSEDGFYCDHCYMSWPWTNEHSWVNSDQAVQDFLSIVTITHKRLY